MFIAEVKVTSLTFLDEEMKRNGRKEMESELREQLTVESLNMEIFSGEASNLEASK